MRVALCFALCAASLTAQFSSKLFDNLSYRFIGPASMGGRVTDIESIPGNPQVAYVATGGGGLWKTMNGGVTWTPIFERQNTFSIGDIALDPRNPDTIWVGTGEANPRNSVSFGDGVYKSTDGGKTWTHMGLEGTERIARIHVHPLDSNIVFVGALGHAFGPHPDRGVFLTTDGGKTWTKTLYIDESHGVADMDIDIRNPNILYAAMWRFERKPWTFTSGSEQGGIFRSIDGGKTWKKLDQGLPKLLGRLGVKAAPSNPRTVYVLAESKEGTLYKSTDGGDNFVRVTDRRQIVHRGFYFTDLRVDPHNENRLYALALQVQLSTDGGNTWKEIAGEVHSDMHAMWIDPKDPRQIWLGSDGGPASSADAGATWRYHHNIPLAQYYQIFADNRLPFYSLTGGQQDNATWTGPSRNREVKGIANRDWSMITFGDGFYAAADPDNPEIMLTESQGGRIVRTDLRTGEQKAVGPSPRASLLTDAKYRFNWNTPIVRSPHGKNTFYFAGNVIFQTSDFGKSWEPISPDLSTNDKSKYVPAGGSITQEATTAENNGTVIVLSESPVKSGVIWAATDDGNVNVTFNGGRSWTNVAPKIPGLAPNSVMSHVEVSRTSERTAYVAADRHMFDDFKPYLFKTTDGGQTFTSIAGDLPAKAYVQVIKEDPKNPQLLYAGTELGLFVSWEGGNRWQRLSLKNMPHVAVHDLLVHPRENDLVVATHGRGLAILDDAAALQQMSEAIAGKAAHFFPVRAAMRFAGVNNNIFQGDQYFYGPNPPPGALLTYYLKEKPAKEKPLALHIFDAKGEKIAELRNPSGEPGLNRVNWNLRHQAPDPRRESSDAEGGAVLGGGQPGAIPAMPGRYTAKLLLGGQLAAEQSFEVVLDPTLKPEPGALESQFTQAKRLRQMMAGVNQALRDLDRAKTQIEASEKNATGDAKNRVTAMKKEIDAAIERFDAGMVPYRVIKAPKLSEEVPPLLSLIAAVNNFSAPTAAQQSAVDDLAAIYARESAAHNDFATKTLPAFNEELRKLNLLGLTPLKPIAALN
jgi:photosystem II stability/assembly factor-like uncharacterized protein